MIKKLSLEGLFECGALEIAKGKAAAFTPVIQRHGMGLGLAIANETGYYPVPLYWCHGDNWDELSDHADELNREHFDLDERAAMVIVASTMSAQNQRRSQVTP